MNYPPAERVDVVDDLHGRRIPDPYRWLEDPADPRTPPTVLRYPAAGTPNPDVTLHVLALDGGSVEVAWDRDALPYVAAVKWVDRDRLLRRML